MKKGFPIFQISILVLAIVSWALFDYAFLPAYNPQSFGFWVLAGFYLAVVLFVLFMFGSAKRGAIAAALAFGGALAIATLASVGSWLIWPGNAARYYGLLDVNERSEADFGRDFPAAGRPGTPPANGGSFLLPVVDKVLAAKIVQGKMGNYGAQFQMREDSFTAISVRRAGRETLLRVAPLDYSGLIVALTGGSRGTAGYVEVNLLTEEARLVEVPGGMKYTPDAYFGRNLQRKVRFAHRAALLGPYTFEVDDEGRPWWIFPVLANRVGLFGGADAIGVILVDPVTGDSTRYDKGQEPEWVDRVVPTSVVQAQANDRLRLGSGWMNAIIGQKREVFQLSDGYNYVVAPAAEIGSTWFVAGVTSPNEADQTVVGFLMVNLRTKEARRYALSGITEMRAMEIASSDERVRAQTLESTWPVLVDVDGQAAYSLMLKNEVQRQRFVFVDVATGQKVAMGETIESARSQFAGMIGGRAASTESLASASVVVLRVKEDAEGSVVFIAQGDARTLYVVPADLSNGARFLSPGDRVEIRYRDSVSSKDQRYVADLRNLSIGE